MFLGHRSWPWTWVISFGWLPLILDVGNFLSPIPVLRSCHSCTTHLPFLRHAAHEGVNKRVKRLAWSSTFKKLGSWHLVSSLHGKLISVQSCSVMSNSLWPHCLQHTRASFPSPTPWSLLRLMSIESMMPSNHPHLCYSLLLPPSIFPRIKVFSNESVLRIRWPKYWNFSFSISPSNEYSGLISFRMDWLDLLAVQGTLRSSPTPQFKSINSPGLSFL